MGHRSAASQKLLERALAMKPSGDAVVVSATISIGQRVHRMLEAMEQVAENRNPTETEAAHALRVSKMAATLKEEVGKARSSLNHHVSDGMRNLQTKIDQATGMKEQGPMAAEMRAVVRAAAPGELVKMIGDAIKAKDAELLSAVLGVHPLLSGIDPKFQQDMRRAYEAEVAPDLLAEQEALLEVDAEISSLVGVADTASLEAARPDYVALVAAQARQAEVSQAKFAEAVASPPFAAE